MPYKQLVIPGLPHHIWLRGNNKRRLFSYPWEYDEFTLLVVDAAETHDIRLHAYSLMPNHAHMAPVPKTEEALSKFVQSFAQRYARRRNQRRGGSGKLFEQRFLRKPVPDDNYLSWLTAYIELNPVKAGLCELPGDWKWSTYNLHAGHPSHLPRKLWTPADWYLELGDSRAEEYARFVADCRATDSSGQQKQPEIRIRRPGGGRAT